MTYLKDFLNGIAGWLFSAVVCFAAVAALYGVLLAYGYAAIFIGNLVK